MQIDINSRKQLNKPENYAAFYSLLNRLPTSDREDSPPEAFLGASPDAVAGHRYGRLGPGERLLPGQPYRRQGVP